MNHKSLFIPSRPKNTNKKKQKKVSFHTNIYQSINYISFIEREKICYILACVNTIKLILNAKNILDIDGGQTHSDMHKIRQKLAMLYIFRFSWVARVFHLRWGPFFSFPNLAENVAFTSWNTLSWIPEKLNIKHPKFIQHCTFTHSLDKIHCNLFSKWTDEWNQSLSL